MVEKIILAAAGATGFALLFGMKKKNVWLITVNSALSWCLYLLIEESTKNTILAMFLVTVLVGLISGVMAIFIKCPLTVFATPILIPFIPGATLYTMMYNLVNKNMQAADDAEWLLLQVGAIAFGILASQIVLTLIKILYTKLRL